MSTGREKAHKGNNGVNLKLASVSLFSPPPLFTKLDKKELGVLSPDLEKEQARAVSYLEPIRPPNFVSKKYLGEGIPPIHVTDPAQQFYTGKIRSKWEWEGFSPKVRRDNLKLFRWKKVTGSEAPDGSLEHHVQLNIPSFSKTQYDRYLESDDWSYEETKHLFALCQRFDLRFLVIHDRFIAQEKSRSLEDLKARYFEVSNSLGEISRHEEQGGSINFIPVSFDKEKEVLRKKYLEGLYSRSRETIDEEESLVVLIRRLRSEGRSFVRKREQLLQILNAAAPPNAHSNLAQKEHRASLNSGENSILAPVKRKRRVIKRASPADEKLTQEVLTEADEAPIILPEPKPIIELPLPPKKENHGAGVFLRSLSVTQTPADLPDSLASCFRSFGLGPLPSMPTEGVCDKFQEVQELLQQVLEARSHLEKLGDSFSPLDGPSSDGIDESIDLCSTDKPHERKRSFTYNESSREKKRSRGD